MRNKTMRNKTMRNKTMRNKTSVLTLSVLCSALIGANAFAADSAGEPGRSSGKKNPLNNVYFGEQHLHTSASPDAFAFGTRTPTTPTVMPRARPSRTSRLAK